MLRLSRPPVFFCVEFRVRRSSSAAASDRTVLSGYEIKRFLLKFGFRDFVSIKYTSLFDLGGQVVSGSVIAGLKVNLFSRVRLS